MSSAPVQILLPPGLQRTPGRRGTPYRTPLEHLNDLRLLLYYRVNSLRSEDDLQRRGIYGGDVNHDGAVARIEATRAAGRQQAAHLASREAANRAKGPALPIDTLCARLGLGAFERTAILLSVLPALDLSAEDDLGGLHDGHNCGLNAAAVFTFMGASLEQQMQHRRALRADAPLRARDILSLSLPDRAAAPEDLLRATITATPLAFAEVLGDDSLNDELSEMSSIEAPLASFGQVVLPEADRARILSLVDAHAAWPTTRAAWGLNGTVRYGRGTLLLFSGPPGTGKTLTAHAVADRLGKRVLTVDIPALVKHLQNGRLLQGVFREARLRDAVLFFDECEVLLGDRARGNTLMTVLLTEIERFEGLAVLATNLPGQLDDAIFRRILLHVRFEAPDATAREAIWRALLPPEAPIAPDVDFGRLARRHGLTGGEVKNALLNACATAFARSGLAGPITHADFEGAAQAQARRPGASDSPALARWSEVTLADVHLPADISADIRHLVAAAAHRPLIRGAWGVAARDANADVALLHGPPGTGKTLCARAVAGELGKPLLTVSLGHLRSKYVGESEANLSAVFRRAAAEEAVLLLDEVDSMLARRGSVRAAHHDDVLTATLLTLLDAHPGLVLLTSNRPDALDPALTRRIGWRVAFRLPDAEARDAIWRSVLPPSAPLHPALRFSRIAARYVLSGGDIRTIALRAAAHAAAQGELIDEALLDTLAATLQATAPAFARAGAPVGVA